RRSSLLMPLSHAQQRLHAQRHGEIQARLRLLELETADLADAVESVAQRVGVHAQPLRRFLLLACLEIGTQRRDEAAVARAVVLHERTEKPLRVVDEPLIRNSREKARKPELGDDHDLAPSL